MDRLSAPAAESSVQNQATTSKSVIYSFNSQGKKKNPLFTAACTALAQAQCCEESQGREAELVVLFASWWLCFLLPAGQGSQQAPSPTPAPSTEPLARAGSKSGEQVNSRNSQKHSTWAAGARAPVQPASSLPVAGTHWCAGGGQDAWDVCWGTPWVLCLGAKGRCQFPLAANTVLLWCWAAAY